jgi:hypothetical protein
MEVLTFTEEFSSPAAAKRLFTAMVLEADTLIPKLVPQAVKSIETIKGNGGPGTIKKLTFAEGQLLFTFLFSRTKYLINCNIRRSTH